MAIFYSPSINGFFTTDLHGDAMPADAKRISRDRHQQLLEAQARGAIIAPDGRGRPIATTLAAIDAEAERARLMIAIKRQASRRISAISPPWRQLNDLRAPGAAASARFAAIDAVRAASDLIEAELAGLTGDQLEAFDASHHPLWPTE